jgi:serine/threonine-protein kinase
MALALAEIRAVRRRCRNLRNLMLDPKDSRFGQAAILSGLMDVERLSACWNAIPPEKREVAEHIDRRLARQAVQSQALTLWQAQQLLAGRTNGFKVDRYILLELIGQGGMGRVYLARDTRLNRRVALKILAPERMSNPRAVARFKREAHVGAQLQHENLVRVYDFGESHSRYFLVMEYIEGKTIGQLLSEQGPMPPATAARLVCQVAQGLAHAHRKGMIHRDVNPYNILVTHDGVAKLADLGLAMDLANDDHVTRDGATVGTFDYVAPEQARHSHSADIRSDIYSLGCSLYHMVAGQVPFPSPSLSHKLYAHQAMEPTPLEQLVPGLPEGLGDVVRTMMRKQPEDRYSVPSQVVQALEPYIDEGAAAGRFESVRSPSDASPRPASGSRAALTPVSRDGPPQTTSASHASSSTEGGSGPMSPQPDQDRALAARAATPGAAIGSSRASAARPAIPGGVATIAGTSTPASSDLDDPSIPLLTPTDDTPPLGIGLPIVVDLGPEPPLTTLAVRSRSVAGKRLAAIFSRAAASAPSAESRAAGATSASWVLSLWRTLPRWVRVGILTAVVVTVLIALLGLGGWLDPIRDPRRKPAIPRRSRSDLEIPGRSHANGPHQQEAPTFVVRSHGDPADAESDATATTLLDAVKAAMGRRKDGYVELRNRAPLQLGPGDFPDLAAASGTLDIRAAPGVQPVIEIRMDGSQPFLATGSGVSLSLSGLTLRVRYPTASIAPSAEPPPVIEAAGRVRIERCAFEVAGQRPDRCRALATAGVGLSVNRCWFLGFDEPIRVKAFDETVTHIRQTMIVPEPGIGQGSGSSPELRGWALGIQLSPGRSDAGASKRRLILENCTIEGAGLLEITGEPCPSPLPVEVDHCAVRADTLLAWKPRKPDDRLDVVLRWKGSANQYQVLGASWIIPEPPSGVTDLKSWSQSKFVSSEVEPIRTRIIYHTDPQQRTDPVRPQDLAIDSTASSPVRAGADPGLVGPQER